jgi:cytochrome c biogenesis protein ResB
MRRVNALYRFFKSVRLAIVLILVITALSLLSTLVPQGRDIAFYQATYSPALYALITGLDFNRYFSSVLFIIPVVMFSLNLGVCAVDRLVRQSRSKGKKKYGPDIVHIALLVLVAGGLVTALGRQAKDFSLGQGEEVEVSPHYSIKLLSFQFLKYENGSPKAWISTVDVMHDGALETGAFPIKVNHPLRLKGLSVYQTTWENQSTLRLRDSRAGTEVTARVGQGFDDGDSFWYIADVVDDGGTSKALFQQYKGHDLVSTRRMGITESLGPYTLMGVTQRLATGLRAVSDPGFVTVIVGVAFLALGLALTFIQNRRKEGG